MTVTVNFPVKEILKNFGMGESSHARAYLAGAVRQRCDKYVPFDTGALKNTVKIDRDGRRITYVMPYARNQFYINYRHRDPNRGPRWHQRMLRRERSALLRQMSEYMKGGAS